MNWSSVDGIDLVDDLFIAVTRMAAGQGGDHQAAECKAEIIRRLERLHEFQHKAALSLPRQSEAAQRTPDGYAYRYRKTFGDGTYIRHNNGGEVNGARPIETIPYYYTTPPAAQGDTSKPIFGWWREDGFVLDEYFGLGDMLTQGYKPLVLQCADCEYNPGLCDTHDAPQPAQADTTPAAHGVGFDSTAREATGVVSKSGTDTGDKK